MNNIHAIDALDSTAVRSIRWYSQRNELKVIYIGGNIYVSPDVYYMDYRELEDSIDHYQSVGKGLAEWKKKRDAKFAREDEVEFTAMWNDLPSKAKDRLRAFVNLHRND